MNTKAPLPRGWEWRELGKIAEIIGGGTPRRDHKEYFKEFVSDR